MQLFNARLVSLAAAEVALQAAQERKRRADEEAAAAAAAVDVERRAVEALERAIIPEGNDGQ